MAHWATGGLGGEGVLGEAATVHGEDACSQTAQVEVVWKHPAGRGQAWSPASLPVGRIGCESGQGSKEGDEWTAQHRAGMCPVSRGQGGGQSSLSC